MKSLNHVLLTIQPHHVISPNTSAIALTTLPHPVRRSIYSTHPRLLHSPLSTSTTGSNLICGFEAQDFSECFDYVSCSFLDVYRATSGQCTSLCMSTLQSGLHSFIGEHEGTHDMLLSLPLQKVKISSILCSLTLFRSPGVHRSVSEKIDTG